MLRFTTELFIRGVMLSDADITIYCWPHTFALKIFFKGSVLVIRCVSASIKTRRALALAQSPHNDRQVSIFSVIFKIAITLKLFLFCSFHKWFWALSALVALADAFDSKDCLDKFLSGPEFTVLDSETKGWHTYMLRMVQEIRDDVNSTYLENVDVVSLSAEQPPPSSFHNTTAVERLKRACGRVCCQPGPDWDQNFHHTKFELQGRSLNLFFILGWIQRGLIRRKNSAFFFCPQMPKFYIILKIKMMSSHFLV